MEDESVQIKIGSREVTGKMTVARSLDRDSNPPRLVIEGVLQTPHYFEEIEEIETERIKLRDILVYRETFGTSEEDIVYNFIAGDLVVKG